MFMSFLCSLLFLLVLGPSFAGAQEQTRKALEPSSSDPVRIYRSPEERREAGLGKQVTEWLKIGGVMDLEKEYRANRVRAGRNSNDDPDPELAVELGFEVQYGEWFEAEVLFAVEENGRRHYQELDEGLIGIDLADFGFKLGQLYVPFGAYYSHFVTGPLLEFGQTRGRAVQLDYTFWDSVELAAYVFESKADKQKTQNAVDWGLSLEYTSNDESLIIGAGYLSDLAESQDALLLDYNNTYQRRVPAWNVYTRIGMPPFELTVEALKAMKRFQEFDKNANKPFSSNFELAYFPVNFLQFALRLEFSDELADEPKWQYGVAATWRPFNNLSVAIDYLYGTYQNDFAFDDLDNELQSHHMIGSQLTVGF
ncbi:MAG: LbtU family siderophore porin [Nitrospirales bacterium]|nr:LbtU family siderophore porin [Nitrospira sp.]MDR4499986.1 LbtU family siderophore porin [Nitrospirales bacterium]